MPPRPTHFLCLPLVTPASLPQLTASIARFAQDKAFQSAGGSGARPGERASGPPRQTLSSDSDTDKENQSKAGSKVIRQGYIPRTAIRPVGSLHLTLGVMHLDTKDKINAVSSFLKELDIRAMLAQQSSTGQSDSQTLDVGGGKNSSTLVDETHPAPLMVQVRGLNAMQQPHKTRVLYAEPADTSGRLLPACNAIRDKFLSAGYVLDEDRDLKLHVTLINTIYASRRSRGSSQKRLEIDATELIERWKDESWAEVELSRLAVCEMGAKEDKDGDVRYVEIAAIDF